ncbi:hypothetical protein DACRYDRAFT_118893 [Dacryopinax primogenitus]|uniref:Uncharacterized protein n=1 Tax=Dacryopinax primogenitus (strain DJM 731) TaxID=1858805 RepID=M5FR93_DACPD|nr:uncharacterized protein DACRYDRAFT_118893 [Dacryopinax primogenitus]EJT98143.1 hypothetical protein DACRYDRAFT_118893 [Dacryopinax primogenitus]
MSEASSTLLSSASSSSTSAAASPSASTYNSLLQSFKSKVVLTATIGGVLVLAVTIFLAVFKISRGIRSYRESKRRRRLIIQAGPGRKGRNAYEIFEWEGVPTV